MDLIYYYPSGSGGPNTVAKGVLTYLHKQEKELPFETIQLFVPSRDLEKMQAQFDDIESGPADQAYGFANVSELELKKRSIKEERYWFDGPYEIISRKSKGHYREVLLGSYEDYKLKYGKFNFTHVIEDKRIPHGYSAYHGIKPSKFLDYIYDINGCIYDNGEVGVWHL